MTRKKSNLSQYTRTCKRLRMMRSQKNKISQAAMYPTSPVPLVVKIEPDNAFSVALSTQDADDDPPKSMIAQWPLYADHEIKEEMVLGPVEIRSVVPDIKCEFGDQSTESTDVIGGDYDQKHLIPIQSLQGCRDEELPSLTAADLAHHAKQIHNPKARRPLLCNQCYQHFANKISTLTLPKKKDKLPNRADDLFSCNKRFCDKGFYINLGSHKHCLGEKRFECKLCEKRFYGKHILTEHMQIHICSCIPPNLLPCDSCGTVTRSQTCFTKTDSFTKMDSFTKTDTFTKQELTEHSSEGALFECDTCEKPCSSRYFGGDSIKNDKLLWELLQR